MFKCIQVISFFVLSGFFSEAQSNEPVRPDTLKIVSVENDMVFVKGDSFQMGSNDGFYDQKPVHTVKVNDFYICKYEITQAQWRAVLGSNSSQFSGCDSCPVENLSYGEAQNFIRKLNLQTGKSYRLPTEAEWEYAARGGNKSHSYKYSGSNDLNNVGWYEGNSNNHTHAVGGKMPNELGLHDMSGNVAEWCSDYYNEFYYSDSTTYDNPQGSTHARATDPPSKVFRGGSWGGPSKYCTVTYRFAIDDFYQFNGLGVRLVRNR